MVDKFIYNTKITNPQGTLIRLMDALSDDKTKRLDALILRFQQVEDFLKIATYLTITYLTIISVLSAYKSAYTRSRLVLILSHE